MLGLLILGLAAQLAAPAPQLSDVEALKVENLKLRIALAQTQAQADSCRAELGTLYQAVGPVRAERASADLTALEQNLKATIEASHPGYEWNPKTGAFTKKGGN